MNSYDEFAYLTAAFKTGHPNRLATLATLFGMTPAPVQNCRVLELGCGDGGNLLPMAFPLPESHFVGLDLAERPIMAGQEMAAHLGVRNATLMAKNILDVTPDLGEFDYIIAHGVYAWVPPPVQDKLLAVCRENLAPNGVAFVSYNAYPGSRLREIAREMFQHFVRPLDTSDRARSRVRQLLEFGKRARPQTGSWGPIMGLISEFLDSHPDVVLAHDEMGEQYRPTYFHQFMEHAGRHDLQYLAEGEFPDMVDAWVTPEEREPLAQLEGDPVILREQYMDFLKCRTFRQTLLCRRGVPLRRDTLSESVLKLLVSTQLRPVAEKPELNVQKPEEFRTSEGNSITLTIAPAKRLLARLIEQWPRRVPVSELITPEAPAKNVGDFLVHLYGLGLIDLESHAHPYVIRPGERPEASRLARLQIERQTRVTNREHVDVQITGEMAKVLLRVADGTRDRAALLEELRRVDPKTTPESLDSSLNGLARLALLTA